MATRKKKNTGGAKRPGPRPEKAAPGRAKAGRRAKAGKKAARSGDLESKLAEAARRLGVERLHPEQIRIIRHVIGGGDALVVLPTGFGKSVCYQVPSMILQKPVVVVSPLLALLQDQYDKLVKLRVPVVRLDSTVTGRARREALERIRQGGSLLVMTTPETLASPEMVRALGTSGLSLVAVDEAHTASEWGHDFRPAYLRLGEVLARYGAEATMGLTATATEPVRRDLIHILDLKKPLVVAASPHRPNLRFEVIQCSGKARLRALTRLVLRLRRPGIVYCATTKDVDAVHGALSALKIPIQRYHGRMTGAERRKEQELFMKRGRRVVMVATSAFGLGIDKPDIRYIVHYQSPASLEQYVQEAGRAGRDGKPAHCVLLYSYEDRPIHEFLLSQSRIRPDQLSKLARALEAWAEESRTPAVDELSASAGLSRRVGAALVAVFEDAALVRQTPERRVEVLIDPDELPKRARQLVERLDKLKRLDATRLDAVEHYATASSCRAQLLRDYFGVDRGEPCGVCDVCRGREDRPEEFFDPLERRGRRKRRRKRGTKRRRRRG